MRIAYLCLCLLLSGSILAQDGPVKSAKTKSQVPAANSSVPLPVSKVVLYKNGVGYFEHKGKVRGDQQFGIESAICERGIKSYATHSSGSLPYGVTQDPSLWRWSPAYED